MSGKVNPPADGIALDGLRRGWGHIERAFKDGRTDREARWNMMSASMQGALAFQKGLGCVHSLSHSLGGVDPRLHHGTLERRVPARRHPLQRRRRVDAPGRSPQPHGPRDGPAARPRLRRRRGRGAGRVRHDRAAGPAHQPGGDGRHRRRCSTRSSTTRWSTTATPPTRAWPAATTTAACCRNRCERRRVRGLGDPRGRVWKIADTPDAAGTRAHDRPARQRAPGGRPVRAVRACLRARHRRHRGRRRAAVPRRAGERRARRVSATPARASSWAARCATWAGSTRANGSLLAQLERCEAEGPAAVLHDETARRARVHVDRAGPRRSRRPPSPSRRWRRT